MARWYFPPEVDYRLSLLHPDAKGLVVWIMEAKVQWLLALTSIDRDFLLSALFLNLFFWPLIYMQVLSKAELQFLAMLPDIRPKVRVIAEVGNWYMRFFYLQFSMFNFPPYGSNCQLWLNHYYMILLDACRRSFVWKPLKQIAGLEPNPDAEE